MQRYGEVHARSIADRDGYWREKAKLVDWQTPFARVLDYDRPPFAHWFVGGRTNLCHNAIDRWLPTQADKPALHWVSTETDQALEEQSSLDLWKAMDEGRDPTARDPE